jgi:hypothetical protein
MGTGAFAPKGPVVSFEDLPPVSYT